MNTPDSIQFIFVLRVSCDQSYFLRLNKCSLFVCYSSLLLPVNYGKVQMETIRGHHHTSTFWMKPGKAVSLIFMTIITTFARCARLEFIWHFNSVGKTFEHNESARNSEHLLHWVVLVDHTSVNCWKQSENISYF